MSQKPFVVSVRALVVDDEGRCLIIRRSDDTRWNPGKWDLPGGKPDPGEQIGEALLREAREETGLNIELTRSAGCVEWELDTVVVVCVFLEARVLGGSLRTSDEHSAHRWIAHEELCTAGLCEEFLPVLRPYSARA